MVEHHKDHQKSVAFTDGDCRQNFSDEASLVVSEDFFSKLVVGMKCVKCTWWVSEMCVGI